MATSVTQDNKGFEIPPGMKGPLIVSGVFHLALVIVAITGLPYIKKTPPMISTPVPVEILPIGEMTTTNKPPVKSRPTPEKEVKEKPPEKKQKPPAPPKVDAVEPPKDIPKPVEPKPKEKVKPTPKALVPPPPSEKLEKPKEKEKPPEEKTSEADQKEQFDSLLKNLQAEAPDVEEDLPVSKTADAPAPSPLAAFSQQLTMSEADALRQQLSRCWSIQAGARYAEELVVEVRLSVNQNRNVTSATIVDQWRYNQDSFFRAAADSAIRAVNSPQCQTLNLPPDKYDSWKDIVVSFDPREML